MEKEINDKNEYKLMSIGTEFEEIVDPMISSTDTRKRKLRWKVIGHVRASRFIGDNKGILTEEIKLISTEYLDEVEEVE